MHLSRGNVEKADMHYMYGHANGYSRAVLRMCQAQFPDRRMPDHRISHRLHHQLRETHSFHVTRYDAGRRRAVRSSSLEKSILNVKSDRPESSTRTVAHHVSGSHQTVCRVLNKNRLHLFHFQRALNSTDYLLRLPVHGTAMC
ncbi:DUF4817 domain-containing protein [Trichonephila clavipes]|nr:DUF4817 domain-containing protein [Trichonephila clavipes]